MPDASNCGLIEVPLYESRLAASHMWEVTGVIDKIVWCIASIGCVFILAASLSSNRIQSKLNLPIVVFLGKISFSVYLLQFIVILCFLPSFVQALNALTIHQASLLLPLTVGAGLLVTVGIAAITYWTIELPSVQLGRWLTKLIQND